MKRKAPTRPAHDAAEITPESRDGTGRDSGGRWLPGSSANPHGRPRVPEEVRAIFDKHTPEAAQKVCDIALDDEHPQQLRALELVLDRGLGKVPQAVEMNSATGNEVHPTVAILRSLGGRDAVVDLLKKPETRTALRAMRGDRQ